MRNSISTLLVLLTVGLGYSQTDTLPKPSGKYAVSVRYLSFTDENRKELFDNTGKSNREITVKAWYPTEEKSAGEPYLLNADFAIKYCMFHESFRNLKTNSGRDLPVSSGKKRYPILIFSHGWGEHFSQNSILMEELASHGYIVFSMAHHFECRYSEYPNGKTVHLDMGSIRFRNIYSEMQHPNAMALLQKMSYAGNDKERMDVLVEMESTLPTGMKESPKYWAEDISFFLDQLERINSEDTVFKGRLDLKKIGSFGMSMGGIASTEIGILDKRVKACINMDGGLHGLALNRTLRIPLLFLNSWRLLGYGNMLSKRSTADCYSCGLKGSDHYSFTDYAIHPIPMVQSLLGTIDGKRAVEIMNRIILCFFDKYLKREKGIDLLQEAQQYPEVEIVSNISG